MSAGASARRRPGCLAPVAALSAVGRRGEARASFRTAHRLMPGGLSWFLGESDLANRRDDAAIRHFEAGAELDRYPDTAWIRELVTAGRDPSSGPEYLDRRPPAVLRHAPADAAYVDRHALNRWYLLLGHLDTYFDIIADHDPSVPASTAVDYYLWWTGSGVTARRITATLLRWLYCRGSAMIIFHLLQWLHR